MEDARFVVPRNQPQSEAQRILTGGKLPFSPISIIDPVESNKKKNSQRRDDYAQSQRDLESNDNSYQSYLVDADGNEYEPYSLAWRYLGLYIDCDYEEAEGSYEEYAYNEYQGDYARRNTRRRTNEGTERNLGDGGDGDGDGDDCQRVLLWAAYHDPRYKGGSIGEYQYYDWTTNTWDDSHCQTRRCARLDCHEAHTHFNLVGVFKETDGLEDWAEQLFKHEGYCIWDEDTYEVMSEAREQWPTYCIQLYYPDDYGNTLYHHIQPEREGNITLGIYTDEDCTQVSYTTTFFDYVVIWYTNYYYGSSDEAESAIEYWNETIASWNEYMTPYKICQPCRAYNLNPDEDGDDDGSGSGDRLRLLGEDNDGEGDEEQWGYNCYDDAGYTNCNQCYKFETKTDMGPAYTEDLERASAQDTILAIRVEGKVYGSGGYGSGPAFPIEYIAVITAVFLAVACVALFLYRRKINPAAAVVTALADVGDRVSGRSKSGGDGTSKNDLSVSTSVSESSESVSTLEEESSEEDEKEKPRTLFKVTTGGKDCFFRIRFGRSGSNRSPKTSKKTPKQDEGRKNRFTIPEIPAFTKKNEESEVEERSRHRSAVAAFAWNSYKNMDDQEEEEALQVSGSHIHKSASQDDAAANSSSAESFDAWNSYRSLEDQDEARSNASAPATRMREDGIFKISESRSKDAPPSARSESGEAWDNYRSLEDAIAVPAVPQDNHAVPSNDTSPTTGNENSKRDIAASARVEEAWDNYQSMDNARDVTGAPAVNATTGDPDNAALSDGSPASWFNKVWNGYKSTEDDDVTAPVVTEPAVNSDADSSASYDGPCVSESASQESGIFISLERFAAAAITSLQPVRSTASGDNDDGGNSGATPSDASHDSTSVGVDGDPENSAIFAGDESTSVVHTTDGDEVNDDRDIVTSTSDSTGANTDAPDNDAAVIAGNKASVDNNTYDGDGDGDGDGIVKIDHLPSNDDSHSSESSSMRDKGRSLGTEEGPTRDSGTMATTRHAASTDSEIVNIQTSASTDAPSACASAVAIEGSTGTEDADTGTPIDDGRVVTGVISIAVSEEIVIQTGDAALKETLPPSDSVEIFYSTMNLEVDEADATNTVTMVQPRSASLNETLSPSDSVEIFYSSTNLEVDEADATKTATTAVTPPVEGGPAFAADPVPTSEVNNDSLHASGSADMFFSCQSLGTVESGTPISATPSAESESANRADEDELEKIDEEPVSADTSSRGSEFVNRQESRDQPGAEEEEDVMVADTTKEADVVDDAVDDAGSGGADVSTDTGGDESMAIDLVVAVAASEDAASSRASQSANAWDDFINFKRNQTGVIEADDVEGGKERELDPESVNALLKTDSSVSQGSSSTKEDDDAVSQRQQDEQGTQNQSPDVSEANSVDDDVTTQPEEQPKKEEQQKKDQQEIVEPDVSMAECGNFWFGGVFEKNDQM